VNRYPRDFRGHGPNPPDARWPGGAKIAVSIVLNYEEGGENNLLHGDAQSEAFLSDIAGAAPWPGQRHWNMESIYDYGARAGFWRLHRLFTGMDIPVTIYGVTSALARNPEQVAAMKAAGWEIASHGLKWVDHRDMPEAEEAAQIAESFRLHEEVVGEPPQGWYTGRCSMNTVRLTAETRKLAWISDTYDDDLPYWREYGDHDQLVIPYTLEANDMRFATAPGYITGEQFFQYLKDSFDTLYAEGEAGGQDVLHRPPLPPDRSPRQDRGAEALPRLCEIPRRRLVPAPHRHRRALEKDPSAQAVRAPQPDDARTFCRTLRFHFRTFPLDRRPRLRPGTRPRA
jgi:putative urate catabolism protein